MPTIESKLIDIEATLLDERERSYWLDDGKTRAWVAKSLVERTGALAASQIRNDTGNMSAVAISSTLASRWCRGRSSEPRKAAFHLISLLLTL
jgi:hypothetical protein